MIRLTHVKGPQGKPTLVLIPGGPGLSSQTLRSLDLLARSFSLAYVDFPGTGGVPYDRDRSFDELASELGQEVSKIEGDVIVGGHSFGGFFAAKLVIDRPAIRGLVCISTPFSADSVESVRVRYEQYLTLPLKRAENEWKKEPSDLTFVNWLAEYGTLYFWKDSNQKGRELLLKDKASHRFFLRNRSEANLMEPMLKLLTLWNGRKLFLADTKGIVSAETMLMDATRGGFDLQVIRDSSHFIMLDQPDEVARRIEEAFAII